MLLLLFKLIKIKKKKTFFHPLLTNPLIKRVSIGLEATNKLTKIFLEIKFETTRWRFHFD